MTLRQNGKGDWPNSGTQTSLLEREFSFVGLLPKDCSHFPGRWQWTYLLESALTARDKSKPLGTFSLTVCTHNTVGKLSPCTLILNLNIILTRARNLMQIIDSGLGKSPLNVTRIFLISSTLYTLWTARNHFTFRATPVHTPPSLIVVHTTESLQAIRGRTCPGKNHHRLTKGLNKLSPQQVTLSSSDEESTDYVASCLAFYTYVALQLLLNTQETCYTLSWRTSRDPCVSRTLLALIRTVNGYSNLLLRCDLLLCFGLWCRSLHNFPLN